MNKRNILVGIAVIFSVLLLGIVIYGNGGSKLLNNTSPSPSPNFKNSKTITVPENYSTISLAINASSEGDTILVKEGTCIESVTVDKSLTIKGENKETTIVDGNNIGPAFLIKGDNVSVTGFKIRNVENPPPFSDSRARMAGIHLLDAHGCNISENVVVNTGKGVWIYGGSGNTVTNNTFSGNNYGILIQSSANNSITGNQASNGWGGIWLESSMNNKLRNNKMLNNSRNFGVSGGELTQYANDVDSSNVVNDGKVYYLLDKKSLVIDPVSYPDLGYLVLVNCTDVIVQNLVVKNNYGGIQIVGALNSTVTHNTVTDNTGGIWVQSSRNCIVSENTVRENTDWGILVVSSNNVLVVRNELTQNTLWSIILRSSSNNSVAENNVRYSAGIYLESSDDNYIRNNVIMGESNAAVNGIELEHSSNNRVELNMVSPGAPGIHIWDESNSNVIVGNILDTDRGSYGISLSGSFNVLARNDIKNFHTSLQLSNGSNNTITENNIESRECLMNLFKFNNNTFYRNNFKGETEIMDYGNVTTGLSSVNMWDNGSQGNYWSSYAGGDENGDGIGEIPYVIDANNQDRYPLKNQWI